jgi:hypothetical protein
MKLKLKRLKKLALVQVFLSILIAPNTLGATEYFLEHTSIEGLREFNESNFEEYEDIEVDSLEDFKSIQEAVKSQWRSGEKVDQPKQADLKTLRLSKDMNLEIEVYEDFADLSEGWLFLIVVFDDICGVGVLTNGTEFNAAQMTDDTESSLDVEVDGAKINMDLNTSIYEYEDGDDWYMMTLYYESSDSDSFICDVAPLSLFDRTVPGFNPVLLLMISLVGVSSHFIYSVNKIKKKEESSD